MIEDVLIELIRQGENEQVEFKASFCEDVIETLVAFANSNGGRVLVGVSDSGDIIGMNVGKENIQKWLNEIKQKTDYKIVPTVILKEYDSRKVVIFRVTEFPSKPISYKGRYYKRIGNSNHQMGIDDIVNDYLRVKNSSWDMFLAENYTLEDLNLDTVSDVIQRINRKREKKMDDDPLLFLKKYGLIQDIYITNAALLLFARGDLDRTDLQIGLFETDTLIKKSMTLKDNLFSEVEQVMDFIMTHITQEYVFTGALEREERWQYPLSAVREFLINAIIHRDYRRGVHSQFKVYRDKIVFWNAGKLPEELTIEDLYRGEEKSYPRNIKIAEIFKEAFLIERYGSGIKRAVDELRMYGLKKPIISEKSGGIEVLISATPFEYDFSNTASSVAESSRSDSYRKPLQRLRQSGNEGINEELLMMEEEFLWEGEEINPGLKGIKNDKRNKCTSGIRKNEKRNKKEAPLYENEGINELLHFIETNQGKRVNEISLTLHRPQKTLERWIKKLKELNHIEYHGSKKTGGYFIK